MRIPLVVSLTPLALALACSDQGPIQGVGPKLTISPATVSAEKIKAGLVNTELVLIAGLAKSKSEAFRLIEQGGITINDEG